MKQKIPLNKILYIAVFLIGIGCIFLISITYVNKTKKILDEESQKMIQEIARETAKSITDKLYEEFEDIDILIEMVVKDPNISIEDKRQKLGYMKQSKEIRNIGIADTEGTLWLANGGNCQIGHKTYFKQALKGNKYISEVMVSSIDGELVVVYAVPVIEENEVTSVVVAVYTAKDLFERVSKGLFEGEGYLYLINKLGYIKYSSKGIDTKITEDHKQWHEKHNKEEEDIEYRFCRAYLNSKENNYYVVETIGDGQQWELLYIGEKEKISANTQFIIDGMYKGAIGLSGMFGIIIVYILISSTFNKKKIYELAYLSHETGLYNRNKFLEEGRKMLAKAREGYSILYFDIDNFRIYNEIFSETFGNELLQEISRQIKENFKSYDILFAHLDRDHFAFLIPSAEEHIILRIIAFMEKNLYRIKIDNHPSVHIILSIGIYQIPKGSKDIEGAINKAGLARQCVKGNHEIRYSFYNEMAGQLLKADRQLELDLLEAIENHQFSIYYQPKFQSNGSIIAGAEALIRWQHPTEGMISPGRFIPLAEANGRILSITRYIIKEVCKDINYWRKEGIPIVPISINFSQIEMYNSGILEYVKECMQYYQIEPKYLEIEITERVALEDLQAAKRMIMAFKELGITVAMDDFGSGYAGTNYIKALPFDVIKIDKGLIDDIETDTKSHQLLLGIVNIMKALGFLIVAEGVENDRQVKCIQNMGIDYIQGYVFAKPLTKQEFAWKLMKED